MGREEKVRLFREANEKILKIVNEEIVPLMKTPRGLYESGTVLRGLKFSSYPFLVLCDKEFVCVSHDLKLEQILFELVGI